MIDGQKRSFMKFQDVRAFLESVLDEDIHTKRVESLANATLGVMTGASLGVALIGKSLAQARGLLPKHAVKQVDRLLSNRRLEAWDVCCATIKTGHPATICHTSDGGTVSGGQADVKPEAASGGSPKG